MLKTKKGKCMRYLLLALALSPSLTYAQPLPPAIDCYQTNTQSEDIDAYMSCFAENSVMTDVSRNFEGKNAIRRWALREVIPYGRSFSHVRILEKNDSYAKTEVAWSTWIAHYHYWWNNDGKITRMSLQYAE